MPIVPPEHFPFCGPSYLAVSPLIDAQRSINLYPEPGYKSSSTQMALIGRPGMTLVGTPDVTQTSVRGLWAGNARLFAAIGTKFYEVSSAAGVITNYGVMPGSSSAPAYAFANGTQLLVVNGNEISLANPGGPSMVNVFHGNALEYLDGFYFAIANGASLAGTNPNQINASNFLDGSTWNALNYVLRTGSADLTTQLATINGLLIVFGQKSLEFWYNAGNPGFPLARVQGSTIGIGLLAPKTVAKFYNTVMWLGADDRGYAQVYMLQGMNPVRVSTPAIENYIVSTSTFLNGLQSCFAYGYQEAGHTFYVLNLCNAGTPISAVVYDLTTGLWHERTYDAGIYPMSMASVGFAFGVQNYVGDFNSGAIYTQDIQTGGDNGADIINVRVAPHLNENGQVVRYKRLDLIQGGNATAAVVNPVLSISDNGGIAYKSNTYSMLQSNSDRGFGDGFTPFYRSYVNQLGRSRDRVFKVTITQHATPVRIAQAFLEVA